MNEPAHIELPQRREWLVGLAACAAATVASPAVAQAAQGAMKAAGRKRVEVMGHRGACALRPEHTLASYAMAIRDGADFVEPDLVCTRDGVLVARHENNLTETTDVARHAAFASRKTRKTIDGLTQEGWFVEDFTLAELKQLRAIERIPQIRPANTAFDGQMQVPTFEEIIEFVSAQASALGRTIGLIPELKHSTYHAAIGLPMEERFMRTVQAHHHTRTQPLVVQSFEVANLQVLREKMPARPGLRLMQLVDDAKNFTADSVAAGRPQSFGSLLAPEGLRALARHVHIVAPWSRLLIPWDASQRQAAPSRVIADAHEAGLEVHTWTLRPENRFMAANFRSSAGDNARNDSGAVAEARSFIEAGIDGFFTDDPATGRAAVQG